MVMPCCGAFVHMSCIHLSIGTDEIDRDWKRCTFCSDGRPKWEFDMMCVHGSSANDDYSDTRSMDEDYYDTGSMDDDHYETGSIGDDFETSVPSDSAPHDGPGIRFDGFDSEDICRHMGRCSRNSSSSGESSEDDPYRRFWRSRFDDW